MKKKNILICSLESKAKLFGALLNARNNFLFAPRCWLEDINEAIKAWKEEKFKEAWKFQNFVFFFKIIMETAKINWNYVLNSSLQHF